MALSADLISAFVKSTNDKTKAKHETTVYGTAVVQDGARYVRLDGSELLTPVSSTVGMEDGDRVRVLIKDHYATVTGNMSKPAANTESVLVIEQEVVKMNTLAAGKVDTEELDATNARVENLEVGSATIDDLTAANARIGDIYADTVTIHEQLNAHAGLFDTLEATKLDAGTAEITYATIVDLEATDAMIHNLEATYGDFQVLVTERLSAHDATIENLNTTYANIDFTNIDKATMGYFYAQSGLIKNVVVGDQTITGELVGVTISGDRLVGNTVVAEKLVIKGSDGLYYKLNTDGMKVEAEQTDENSINGQVIKAKSITATKISVDDLVAFDATIGGFHIGDHSLYSGVKESATNTTRGVFLGDDGQVAFGDSVNYLKYYKDADGNYKLAISADSLVFSSGTSVKSELEKIQNGIDDIEIGGRNLISGTKDLSGFYSNRTNTTYVIGSDGYTYADFPAVTTLDYRAISSTHALVPIEEVLNKQVVFSFELRADTAWTATGSEIIVGFALCNDSSTTRIRYRTLYLTDSITTDWTKFEVKATLTEDFFSNGTESISECTRFYVQIYNYSLNHLQARKLKLEYGNKATDWTPSLEDTQKAIDSVEVGGRNLLLHTGSLPIVANHTDSNGIGLYVTGTGTLTDTGDGLKLTYDSAGKGAIAVPLINDGAVGNNETVTVSFKYRTNMTRTTYAYFLQRTSPNVTLHGFPAMKASATEWLEYKHTFSHTDANARTCYSFMFAYNPGTDWAGTWVEIKKESLKLERGNRVTDWTPATEDVDAGIDDAAKTATNFLSYDSSNGLQIGDRRSASWAGFRTQITNAAFRILNSAGTALAHYGDKLVEIGRNATDAVIKMCGGKGIIQYVTDEDSGDNYFEINSEKLRLRSSVMSALYSMFTDNSTRWEKSAVNVSPTKVSMYASECIDPTLVEKVEGWTTSEFDMDGTDISATADYMELRSRKGTKVIADTGSIELRPNARLYSSRQIIVSTLEKTKHNDGIKGWYIGTDGTAHATHETGGPIIAFHFAGSTANTSTIAESAAGEIKINGMRFGVNKVLWSGGSYMGNGHTAPLNEAVSKQANGIVLVWSYYQDGAAKNHSFTTNFIPKQLVAAMPNCPHTCLMAINSGLSTFGAKYVYIDDTVITGHATNTSSGTAASGITFSNANYVLRYVIGV